MSRRARRDAAWNAAHELPPMDGRERARLRSQFNTYSVPMYRPTSSSINKRRRHAKRHGKR